MRVTITEDCIACELCVESCPEVFTMRDDMAQVRVEEVAEEHRDCVRQAAQECPTEAIVVQE